MSGYGLELQVAARGDLFSTTRYADCPHCGRNEWEWLGWKKADRQRWVMLFPDWPEKYDYEISVWRCVGCGAVQIMAPPKEWDQENEEE